MSKNKKNKNKDSDSLKTPASDLIEDAAPQEEEVPMTVEQERDDLHGRLQRLAADYQNFQKRTSREIQQAREFANEQLIKSLLSVLDDMTRALDAARDNHGEEDPLFKGMQLVHDKASEILGNFGLTLIEANPGQAFDPDKHSAMMQQPTADQEHMTILAQVQQGYQLKNRTIRPAGVVVAVKPEEPTEDENIIDDVTPEE